MSFIKHPPLILRELPLLDAFEQSYKNCVTLANKIESDPGFIRSVEALQEKLLSLDDPIVLVEPMWGNRHIESLAALEPNQLNTSIHALTTLEFLHNEEVFFIDKFALAEDIPGHTLTLRMQRLTQILSDIKTLTSGIPVCFSLNNNHYVFSSMPNPETSLVLG